MMADILFDVDGVLVHGYHAKPAFCRHWDEQLETDFEQSLADNGSVKALRIATRGLPNMSAERRTEGAR